MSLDRVRRFLSSFGREADIRELPVSTATVPLAARALGVEEARIAKTISLADGNGCLVVVTAGDTKIDNGKFKRTFGFKPSMLPGDRTEALTGHPIGGVCPFALPAGVRVFLDDSLRRFATVFPAAGSTNTAIEMTCDELETCSGGIWVDVCKPRIPVA